MGCSLVLALLGVCPPGCQATRNAGITLAKKSGKTNVETYEVNLLIGRHGISCTNLVEKYSSWGWYDAGRGNIADPLLTGIGVAAVEKARTIMTDYLGSIGLKVDASLASVLGRAIQTAMMTYPHVSPVYVVPHAREQASGASNLPEERSVQVEMLRGVTPRSQSVNYRWADAFGVTSPGDWNEFMRFLEKIFLPDFLKRSNKTSGDKIVLAITTHSLLMANSKTMKSKCGHLWETKPNTNQVVHLKYDFTVTTPSKDKYDTTPSYVLDDTKYQNWCVRAHTGSKLNKENKLCVSDIGDSCLVPITTKAWDRGNILEATYEGAIVKMAEQMVNLQTKISQGEEDAIKDFEKIGIGKENIEATVRWKQQEMEELQRELLDVQRALSQARKYICASGTNPDVHKYLEHRAIPNLAVKRVALGPGSLNGTEVS